MNKYVLFPLLFITFIFSIKIHARSDFGKEYCYQTYKEFSEQYELKPGVLEYYANNEMWDFVRLLHPWQGGIFPNLNLKKRSYFKNRALIGSYPGVFFSYSEIIDYLEGKLDISQRLSQNFPAKIDTYEVARNLYAMDSTYKKDFADMIKTAKLLCATYFSTPQGCSNSLEKIFSLVHPIVDENLHQINAEVMGEEIYRKPIVELALKVHSRITNEEIEAAFIFDDAIEAFMNSGIPKDKAAELTFKLLGSLSNNGANSPGYMGRYIDQSNYSVITSIGIISAGLYVLDSIKLKKGHHYYSLPPQYTGNCEFGKPYHFWMAAFLARYFKNEKGSETAAYLSGLGYQAHSPTVGRSPKEMLAYDSDSPQFNSKRIELVFSRLGTYFGTQYSTQKPIKKFDIDKLLWDTFIIRHRSKPMTVSESVDLYNKDIVKFQFLWDSIVRPRVIYQLIQ